MANKEKDSWYAPLAAQFALLERPMPLSRFAAIEAVLHLLVQNAPDADPAKAYLLFAQYQMIGATSCTVMEHTLQRARRTMGYYRSKKYWQDDLHAYQNPKYDALRAFTFGDGTFARAERTYPYPYEERQKEWVRFWAEESDEIELPDYAENGVYHYQYQDPETEVWETVTVHLEGGKRS